MRNHRVPPDNDELFNQLSASLREMARSGVIRNDPKASPVLTEGESSDSLYVVLTGSVKVFATDNAGPEIHYNTILSSDYFGELSLDGGPRSASVMTREKCTFAVVSRDAVTQHLARRPAFAMELVTQVISRARKATGTVRIMALVDVYGRVVHVLERMRPPASPGSGNEPVVIRPLTHLGIATRVGSNREMVSRTLKELKRDGYLKLGVKRVTLLKTLAARESQTEHRGTKAQR